MKQTAYVHINQKSKNSYEFKYDLKNISDNSSLFSFRLNDIRKWYKQFFNIIQEELFVDNYVVVFSGKYVDYSLLRRNKSDNIQLFFDNQGNEVIDNISDIFTHEKYKEMIDYLSSVDNELAMKIKYPEKYKDDILKDNTIGLNNKTNIDKNIDPKSTSKVTSKPPIAETDREEYNFVETEDISVEQTIENRIQKALFKYNKTSNADIIKCIMISDVVSFAQSMKKRYKNIHKTVLFICRNEFVNDFSNFTIGQFFIDHNDNYITAGKNIVGKMDKAFVLDLDISKHTKNKQQDIYKLLINVTGEGLSDGK